MPPRRRRHPALAGAFNSLSNSLGVVLHSILAGQQQKDAAKESDTYQRDRAADQLVMEGKITPEQGAAFKRGEAITPTVSQRVSSMYEQLDKAPSFQEVPSEISAKRQMQGMGITTEYPAGFNPVHPELTTDWTPTDTQPVKDYNEARRRKLESFPPTSVDEVVPGPGAPGTSVKRRSFVSSDPATLTGQTFQTEPTPEQAGANKQTELIGGELSKPVVDAKAAQVGQEQTARTLATGEAERTLSGMTSQQQTAANQLRSDYTKDSADFFTRQEQMRTITSLVKSQNAANPSTQNPMADLSIIYSFVTMNDPRTGVKDAEQRLISGAGDIPEMARVLWQKLRGGASLTNIERNNLLRSAAQLYNSSYAEQKRRDQFYGALATNSKLPVDSVVKPYAPDVQQEADQDSALDQLRRNRSR